ncbi:HlyC/CorC family transporter [Clostridium massiliamazoniense]|uniref:HlyC/CorC family transporter n=1 Tax=Clostridium massiliamazoniense TaxID=1347366 RepID=UPI0006D80D44|nr:hemolysin family protein [Clostridium massiliamazoniense]
MDPFTGQVIILIIMVFLSGFYSASETALMSVNRIRMKHLSEEGVKKAQLVYNWTEDPHELLATILVANNVINIAASSLATTVAYRFGGAWVAIATGIMTVVILIFSEITPKSLAKQYSEGVSQVVIKPVIFTVYLLKPIVWLFNKIASFFIRILGGDPSKAEAFITQEELKTLVDVGGEEGVIEEEEKEMIFNVFEFGDHQVKDIMVQRVDIIAESVDVTYEELLAGIKEYQFSRIPIYEETIDDIVGILFIKDLILLDDESKKDFDVRKHMRKPYYTFEFKNISDLFEEMKNTRNHISVVLDEYGGTVGMVTIEDLIEEIVGEIEDEYDEVEDEVKEVKENEYEVDGSTRLEDLSDIIEDVEIASDEFDSVGGFIIGLLDRLPEEGEEIEYENLKFKVEEIEKKRIMKVRIFVLNSKVAKDEE